MENIIDNLKKSRNCKKKQYYLQELVHFANKSKKNMKSFMEYEGISVILEKAIKACKQEGGGMNFSTMNNDEESPPNVFESLDNDSLRKILLMFDNKTIIKFAATNQKLKQKVIDSLLKYTK